LSSGEKEDYLSVIEKISHADAHANAVADTNADADDAAETGCTPNELDINEENSQLYETSVTVHEEIDATNTSSSASSDKIYAVKTNDTSTYAIFFDEKSAQLYRSSVSQQEESTIETFCDVVSANEFLHPTPPSASAHPINPINIGCLRGEGGGIDYVSQTIIEDIRNIYSPKFDVKHCFDTYLHYLHTEKNTPLLAYHVLKQLLKEYVGDIDDDNIDKLSCMILRVTARAFVTLPTRKDNITEPTTDKILSEVQLNFHIRSMLI
jgi:hypothetical protein